MNTPDEILALYDRRRAVSRRMTDELFMSLDRAAGIEAGRRLGILVGGTLVFANESDTAVFGDAGLFETWTRGENIVRRALRTAPPPEGTPEREVLEAMCDARFSVYVATRTVPGVGVYVEDAFRKGEETLVVDRGLALSGEGFVMASRLLPFPEFAITTGAGIPIVTPDAMKEVADALGRRFGPMEIAVIDKSPATHRADFFYIITQTLLASGQGPVRRIR